ncbi:general secretion pathway protein C [Legionella quinlivanii]|uniref:General secretion pathway protein C n=1 Tax=Legionella quinlivanii TaxID=45073 RepID=A0A0W0Y4L1_9GAMM|nr:type II secretion system protein N [Legionella quinlivanii]KTD51606.1 general secretion pathway protein C [Legionella quinlivanii]SEF60508.1 general secretion pathway protein C [Legionella quinlivanii DSM 21216]STY10867.1 general secretion pathway protein C [Legionella quinlivanii]
MRLTKLNSELLGEPVKLIAILLFTIFLGLFLTEMYSLAINSQEQSSAELNIERVKPGTSQEELNKKSPIFKAALFGVYVPVNLSGQDIKESMLDLEIVGIMYSPEKNASQVLIRSAGGQERLYVIGDSLPGGATIKSINEQDIVVLHNGALESIKLPKNQLHFDGPVKPLFKD